jgi:hypothetical protein
MKRYKVVLVVKEETPLKNLFEMLDERGIEGSLKIIHQKNVFLIQQENS